MSKFKDKVFEIVKIIPAGKVGWILSDVKESDKLPWWRVVNNTGRISIKGSKYGALEQKDLLEKEGLKIETDLTFEIKNYRFLPSLEQLKKWELEDEYIDKLLQLI